MDENSFFVKKTARLKSWMIAYVDHNDTYVLVGNVYDHETEPDGATVMTSVIRSIDFISNIAETKNRFYKLEDRKKI